MKPGTGPTTRSGPSRAKSRDGNGEPVTGSEIRLPAPGSRLPGTRLQFTADADAAGERLDRYITAQIPDYSRSQIQRLIENGQVTHSRYARVKANSDIREGDLISIELPDAQPSTAQPEDLP